MLQPSESKTEHDGPALSTVVSYTGHGGYFLFEITIQAPEATKLKSATSFIFFSILHLTFSNLSQRDRDIVF